MLFCQLLFPSGLFENEQACTGLMSEIYTRLEWFLLAHRDTALKFELLRNRLQACLKAWVNGVDM